ncbi:alpha/beta fold hydrolase [Rubellicoccus peritrichatus]|uniref:Alpha/beta fold hydrolase n=1 Tax=Rubellicoccus peritrichatus TaxID=3080537 RepID=A0AAQ3LE58_9BACT|nr:alpha/beta fold hydrolase [Puniceicoccus sp. CR14]WOO42849.1 alpha/beta fold hydrolase [Puniceicoccus sp. CR14]
MELAYRYFGGEGKPPLIILHGLLGSSRNWTAVGKDLSERFEVFGLDLRNHGSSPHDDEMSFEAMAADLSEFLERQGLDGVHLLGHSLGGKVAMHFAANNFDRVDSLIVVDIAPKDYGLHFSEDFEAMAAINLEELSSRKAADEALADTIPDWAHRQFLLTNLIRGKEGAYQWAANIPVLHRELEEIRKTPLGLEDRYAGPTLFLTGELSDFVQREDHAVIREYFPRTVIKQIYGVGHNLHAENREAFIEAIDDFMLVDWGCQI